MHDKDTTGSRVRENCLHGSVERRTQKCDPSTLAYSESMKLIYKMVPEIRRAKEVYERAKTDPKSRVQILALEKVIRDEANRMHVAKDEGKAEGLVEGEAKGETKKARETAVNALGMGLSVEQISKLTGLSQEEITGLKQ